MREAELVYGLLVEVQEVAWISRNRPDLLSAGDSQVADVAVMHRHRRQLDVGPCSRSRGGRCEVQRLRRNQGPGASGKIGCQRHRSVVSVTATRGEFSGA